MKKTDYLSMNGFEKFVYNLTNGIKNLPGKLWGGFKNIGKTCAKGATALGKDLKEIGTTFAEGDFKTRISFVIMGFGPLLRKQFARGLAFLAVEIAYIAYMAQVGWVNLADILTLGTVSTEKYFNDLGIEITKYGDNSFFILLFSVLSIVFTIMFILVWRVSIRENRNSQLILAQGKKLPTNGADLRSLLDEHFDKTLLTLPLAGILIFTVVPIIFMICVAFTNYDSTHQPPANLFTWVGFENFLQIFNIGSGGFGNTFFQVLGWTLVWAFFATFLNYFLGMGVAMLINRKGIKFKKMWRTILVMTIAVPQFVSLLYVYKMFGSDGMINNFLMAQGWIQSPLPFWTNGDWARVVIILINCWIGIPYTMLISTGLLMNIPADLYESARIDGASPFQMFRKITLPYMLFVTGPYLLTTFTGNLNNFNVIYLLTGGGPMSDQLTDHAGRTDLLVTWLYDLTVGSEPDYKLAAVIGIMVFVVVATISLVVYGFLPSVKDEEGFQ